MKIEVTNKNFKEVVLGSKLPVLVDFWASFCGPCKLMLPVVDKLAEDMEGKALVVKISVEEFPEIATEYGIRNIPALLFFKNGEMVDRNIGAVAASVLRTKLEDLAQ